RLGDQQKHDLNGFLLGFFFWLVSLWSLGGPKIKHTPKPFFFILRAPPFQIPPLRSVANTKGVGRCHLSHEDCKDCYVKPRCRPRRLPSSRSDTNLTPLISLSR